MRYLFILTVFTALLGGGHYYIGHRLVRSAPLSPALKRLAWAVVIILGVLPLLAFAARVMGQEGWFVDAFAWLGYGALGVSVILLLLLGTRDLIWIPYKLATRSSSAAKEEIPAPKSSLAPQKADLALELAPRVDRRALLWSGTSAAIVVGTGGLSAVGFGAATGVPEVRRVDVPIAGLPKPLEGFTIAQLTDVHIGPTLKRLWLEAVVRRTSDLSPDVIAVTGDLVDGSVDYLRADVEPLKELAAKHGVYFVTGNHEYYSGADAWLDEVTRLGMTALLNDGRALEVDGHRVYVAGVADPQAGRFDARHTTDIDAAMRGASDDDVKLLLAHQPKAIDDAARVGIDLQVSGHTHGGQIFPFGAFAGLAQPYVEGLHAHNDKTNIYVSKGTGFWGPPVRLFTPSEITLLRLVQKSA